MTVAASGRDREPAPPADAAPAFLRVWRRSLTGTWVVEQRFDRVLANGRRLSSTVHRAQRPPESLVCSAATGKQRTCEPPLTTPFDARVARDMALLRGYVTGRTRLYAVTAGDSGCFRLRLVASVLTPPYGRRATFCFDAATGAPLRSEVRRDEGIDRITAVKVGVPTDADLRA